MMKLKTHKITLPDGTTGEYQISSGNVFADLGLPNPEERLLKAKLAIQIQLRIDELELTQAAAAKLTGLTQPKISEIFNGRLRGYSVERLISIINKLGCDVEVNIKRNAQSEPGHIVVTTN